MTPCRQLRYLHGKWPPIRLTAPPRRSVVVRPLSVPNFWVGAVRYTSSLLRGLGSVPSDPRRSHRVSPVRQWLASREIRYPGVQSRRRRACSSECRLWVANMRMRSIKDPSSYRSWTRSGRKKPWQVTPLGRFVPRFVGPERFRGQVCTRLPKVCFDSTRGITLETFISRVGADT
jgi:hypothetical protein